MKQWLGLAGLVFVGVAGWRIGNALSPDALSMAVGLLFGVMAGVPTALLVMAGSRRRSEEAAALRMRSSAMGQPSAHNEPWGYSQPAYATPPPPPIIIVAGPQGYASQGHGSASMLGAASPAEADWFAAERPARRFAIVGEQEQLLEEW
jgi:hypothetical protein